MRDSGLIISQFTESDLIIILIYTFHFTIRCTLFILNTSSRYLVQGNGYDDSNSFCTSQSAYAQKTLSYYIMHITVAMLVAYVVTGNLWVALTLSMLEPTVQAFAFYSRKSMGSERTACSARFWRRLLMIAHWGI